MTPIEKGRGNLAAGIFSLLATFIFVVIFSSGRFVSEPVSPLQVMFLRYVGGIITIVSLALLRGENWRSLQSSQRPKQVLRVLAGGLGGAALIFGNTRMPIVDANAISLLSVVFAVGLGSIFLGDKLSLRQLGGGIVCLAGASTVMASRGALVGFDASFIVPAGVVVTGAFLLGVEGIYIKLLTTADRPVITIAHANVFGALLLAVPAALTWQSMGWVNLLLLCLGPLAILGQYLNIRAYSLAKVSVLAPLGYCSLIFAALLGVVFFNETPTIGVVTGAALIAGGGGIIVLSKTR